MSSVSAMAPSPAVPPQQSIWQSPEPYLFGGLAAMMGLISFALLILGCSYWKHWDDIESGNGDDVNGNSQPESCNNNQEVCDMQEKYLVIMAGEEKPTFLATASSSRTTSFGSSSWRSSLTTASSEVEAPGAEEMMIK